MIEKEKISHSRHPKDCIMATATQSRQKKASSTTEKPLNSWIQKEIDRLAEIHGISQSELESFAQFVIANQKKAEPKPPKPPKPLKPLPMTQLKKAVFQHFHVMKVPELRKSGSFQLATSSMGKLDLAKAPDWETLYRKFIGVLPHEENEQGYGCINGVNIFKYDMPWKTFGLNPEASTTADVKAAYHTLSKVYHPDNRETGDAQIFDRLTTFYKSLTEKF
jgi:DnaJ domain